MDWSSLNHMAVALNAGMYVWNATDGNILELFQKEDEGQYISSVKWIKVRKKNWIQSLFFFLKARFWFPGVVVGSGFSY